MIFKRNVKRSAIVTVAADAAIHRSRERRLSAANMVTAWPPKIATKGFSTVYCSIGCAE